MMSLSTRRYKEYNQYNQNFHSILYEMNYNHKINCTDYTDCTVPTIIYYFFDCSKNKKDYTDCTENIPLTIIGYKKE